jgi:hypothetical protein
MEDSDLSLRVERAHPSSSFTPDGLDSPGQRGSLGFAHDGEDDWTMALPYLRI